MEYVAKPKNNGTVFILGAGASYGALIKDPPPIMKDFIKIGYNRIKSDYSKLWKFLDKIGYPLEDLFNGTPNLEEVYSLLHIISTGLWFDNEDEFIEYMGIDFCKFTPVRFLESFIIELTNMSSLNAIKKSCTHHDKLIKKLNKGDTIVSFNYDLIADVSLLKSGKWSEIGGYGFICYDLLDCMADKQSDFLLLKPHGSLNWKLNPAYDSMTRLLNKESTVFRHKSLHETLAGMDLEYKHKINVNQINKIDKACYSDPLTINSSEFWDKLFKLTPEDDKWKLKGIESNKTSTFIIPPTLYKFGESLIPSELASVWSSIRMALSIAKHVVIIGYSFPNTDLHFNALFRLSLNNNINNPIIDIVNPDTDLKNKINNMVPKLSVVHNNNFLSDYINK